MTLKRLFKDEDAVSPVIGVILMVAITVILAAVIGTFVLGLGDQVQQNGPTASLSFAQDGAANDDDAVVSISHDSGESLNTDNIQILVEGENKTASSQPDATEEWAGDGSISAGETVSIHENGASGDVELTGLTEGDTVAVVWTSDDGSQSDTLQEYTVS